MARKIQDALKQDKNVKPPADPLGLGGAPALKLAQVAKSKVRASVGRSDCMSKIELCLFNDGKRPAVVEVTGTVLLPSDDSHQRLFVAGRHDVAISTVRIPSGREVKIPLATCCMDHDLRTPALAVDYRVSDLSPRRKDLEAAYEWIKCRRAVAGADDAGAVQKSDKYAIQNEYSGAGQPQTAEVTSDVRKHSSLGWVQKVCWDEQDA